MTPRTSQWEVFWALLSSFEHSGVPEDLNPHFFQVLGFTLTLGQSRVATLTFLCEQGLGKEGMGIVEPVQAKGAQKVVSRAHMKIELHPEKH